MEYFYDPDSFNPFTADASSFYGPGLADFEDNQVDDRYNFTGSNTNQYGGSGDFVDFTGSQGQSSHQPMKFPPASTGELSYSEHVSLLAHCLLNDYIDLHIIGR
jgi:hypothetical protein